MKLHALLSLCAEHYLTTLFQQKEDIKTCGCAYTANISTCWTIKQVYVLTSRTSSWFMSCDVQTIGETTAYLCTKMTLQLRAHLCKSGKTWLHIAYRMQKLWPNIFMLEYLYWNRTGVFGQSSASSGYLASWRSSCWSHTAYCLLLYLSSMK